MDTQQFEYTVKRLARVLAIQAEIEGMKAQNENSKILGLCPVYEDRHFSLMANQLADLSNLHNEQL